MLKLAIRNIPYLRVLLRMTCLLCAPELMCPLAERQKNLKTSFITRTELCVGVFGVNFCALYSDKYGRCVEEIIKYWNKTHVFERGAFV